MTKLFIAFLCMLWPAVALADATQLLYKDSAVAWEFYGNSTTTSDTNTGTYEEYLELAADRSGESGTGDFVLIASFTVYTDSTGTDHAARLTKDDGDGDPLYETTQFDTNSNYWTHSWVAFYDDLSAASHTWQWDYQCISCGTATAVDASMVLLEVGADTEVSYTAGPSCHDTTTWTTMASLTFQPATTQNYLLLFAGGFMYDDEDNPDCAGPRFTRTSGTPLVYASDDADRHMSSVNDGLYTAEGMAYYEELSSASTHTIAVQVKAGTGGSDSSCVQDVTIVAIPESHFVGTPRKDIQTANSFHQGTTWSASTVDDTHTYTAGDYLVVTGARVGNESSSSNLYPGWGRMDVAGSYLHMSGAVEKDCDATPSGGYLHLSAYKETFGAGSKRIKIDGNTDQTSSSRRGCVGPAAMWIGEVQTP